MNEDGLLKCSVITATGANEIDGRVNSWLGVNKGKIFSMDVKVNMVPCKGDKVVVLLTCFIWWKEVE